MSNYQLNKEQVQNELDEAIEVLVQVKEVAALSIPPEMPVEVYILLRLNGDKDHSIKRIEEVFSSYENAKKEQKALFGWSTINVFKINFKEESK